MVRRLSTDEGGPTRVEKPRRNWEEAWQAGRTGWDAGASPPALQRLVETGGLQGETVLVPGCGAGYDVLTLADAGFRALGLDVAPTAAERFEALRAGTSLDDDEAYVAALDFFDFEPMAPFDLIWDYTFLCALEPAQRAAWARRMDELLAPGGELVTLLFPVVDPGPELTGPPFALDPETVRDLLEPTFRPVHLAPVDVSHDGRKGKEWLARWRRVADG